MQSIKINHFHRTPILLKLLLSVWLPLCLTFLIIGIKEQIAELIVIGAILLVCAVVGEGFFWNYGLKITPKRVTVINQRMLKSFRYEDVIAIKIVFLNESIEGEIKVKNQKACKFRFDGIDLSAGSVFFPRLWRSDLRITKKFVDKSIASLSRCEKVKIENLYALRKK